MNGKIVCFFLGWVLLIEGIAMIIPCLISLALGENDVWPYFLICIGFCFLVGFFLARKKYRKGTFYAREGYTATALGWVVLSLIGAFPFFLSGRIPHYVDALFEIASGFTTTGSSVLSDVESLGKGLLFWRSFSHWLGGMGVLVLILAILPMNGGYNMQIMKAESPGPSVSKLVPRVRETALILYLIYFGLTVAAIISYRISGMSFFDAVCIGVGTAGTGGFAVRNSGMGEYSNVSQALITLFMILFGVNFNVYYLIVRKRWKDAFSIREVWIYLGIVFTVIVVFSLTMIFAGGNDIYYSIHHSAFTTASLISSTGFSTVDFNSWPVFAKTLVLLTMFCGACAGSTGGGFKVSRLILLLKEAKNEFITLVHPNSVKVIKMDGKKVDSGVLRSVNHYLIIYVCLFMVSVFLISFDGFDFETNFSAVLATVNNIGPGLSSVGPTANFSGFSVFSKLVLTFDMIAGRLELLPMLVLFNPKTWTKHF